MKVSVPIQLQNQRVRKNSENTEYSIKNFSQYSQKPTKTANFPKRNSYYSTFSDSGASNVSDNFQRMRVNHCWMPKVEKVDDGRSGATKSCFAYFSNRNSRIHHDVRDNVARFYNNHVNISRSYPINQSVTMRGDKFWCSNFGVHDFVFPRLDINRQTNFSKF